MTTRPAWFRPGLPPALWLWLWPLPVSAARAGLARELGIEAKAGDSQARGLVHELIMGCCSWRCWRGTLISSLWACEASSARCRWKPVSGSSGVNPWRGGIEAKSSFECGWVGGMGVLRGEWEMRLVAEDSSARSGVRIMLRVLSVNGEAALDESIDAMACISDMLRCLNG